MSKRSKCLVDLARKQKEYGKAASAEPPRDDDGASESSAAPSLSASTSRHLANNGYPWEGQGPSSSNSRAKCSKWIQSSGSKLGKVSDVYDFTENDSESERVHEMRPLSKRFKRTLEFESQIEARVETNTSFQEKLATATKVASLATAEVREGLTPATGSRAASSRRSSANVLDDTDDNHAPDHDLLQMPGSPEPDENRVVHHSSDEEADVDNPATGQQLLNEQDGTPQSQCTSGSKRRSTPRDNVRKRPLCPSKWLNNVSKAKLNAGEYHVTPKGVVRRARSIKPACDNTCRRCKRRLTDAERDSVFSGFWALPNINRKRDFISRHVRSAPPKTCSTLPERAKESLRTYFFVLNDVEVKVCKTMFLNTLGVADCWVNTALKKCKNGSGSPDKRGTHMTRPQRTRPKTEESIDTHINLFPRVYAHYTRENTRREYLETGLSVQRMHSMYLEWLKDNVQFSGTKPASLSIYRKYFNGHFNLDFHVPRKDQCELCNRWKHCKTQEERRSMVKEYLTHLENKKMVKTLKEKDKETASDVKCVAAFDLQKVLSCPRSETSLFFYRNKLSLFNFTVFDLRLLEGHCYVWNETEAGKGSNEIATNLFNFMSLKAESGCKEFFLYSDGPSGQNRNRYVFSMYLIASAKFKISITHRFLESGHSYSEVDSMHARIENEIKRREIFSQREWEQHILGAKQTGEKYKLEWLTNERVLNFKKLVDQQVWDKDSEGTKIMWSQVRDISISYGTPNTIKFRYNFKDPFKKISVAMKDESIVDLQKYKPPRAYDKKIPLKENKKKDIAWLMKKKAIPSKYHDEYTQLLAINP